MGEVCFGLEGKVAVVTGGSRGIGRSLTAKLLSEGASVLICGRKQQDLESALSELNSGDRLKAVGAHIGKEEQVSALFDAVMDYYGRLDILINNVGMNLPTPDLADLDLGLWQKIIETNLNGSFLCSRAGARIMKGQGSGKIISVSSIAAHRASPAMGVYGVAKAGIEMMTKVLARELAPHIQVNAVAPGMVKTGFSKPFWSVPEVCRQITSNIPMGRIAEIDDVVGPVLFLASSASEYITGQTLVVDGGATVV